MRNHLLWTLTIAAVALSSVAAAARPSADAMLRDIENRGAASVVRELWDDEARLSAVLEQIESGQSEWLEVARRLKEVSDAGASLSLDYAVARALLKRPKGVLGLVGGGFDIGDICTSPFIEPEKGVAEQYEKRALKVLARLDRSAVGPRARECAALIRLPH